MELTDQPLDQLLLEGCRGALHLGQEHDLRAHLRCDAVYDERISGTAWCRRTDDPGQRESDGAKGGGSPGSGGWSEVALFGVRHGGHGSELPAGGLVLRKGA